MKRGLILGLLAYCFVAPQAHAADSFLDHIKLRRSVADKNTIEKPAQFFFQSPQEGPDTYSIDAGLTLDLTPADLVDRWDVGPTMEYHRQSQTKKEQDTFQGGLSAIYLLGDVTQGWAVFNQTTIEYKKDNVKNTEGAQGAFEVMPLIPGILMGRISHFPACLPVVWQPTLALEVEDTAHASQGGPVGTITRGKGALEFGCYPLDDYLGGSKRLEVVVAYSYWSDIDESGALGSGDKTHKLFRASSTLYLDKHRVSGVGLDYVNGADPSEGMPKQEFVQLSLKLKY